MGAAPWEGAPVAAEPAAEVAELAAERREDASDPAAPVAEEAAEAAPEASDEAEARAPEAAEEAEAITPLAAEEALAMIPDAWLAALPVRELTALWPGRIEPTTLAAALAAGPPVTEANAPVRMGTAGSTVETEAAACPHCAAAYAIAAALSTSPQAWREQSLMPYAQFDLVQKHEMSPWAHWN